MALEPPDYRARTLKDAFRVCHLGALTGVELDRYRVDLSHVRNEAAIALYQESLAIQERIGNAQGQATTLSWLGELIAQQGEVDQGIAHLQESVTICEKTGSPRATSVRKVLERVQQPQG